MRMHVIALSATLSAATAIGLAATAHAHHGWSSYNASETITVTGPIDEIKVENPHAMMWIMHEGARVEVYLAPPARMMNRGLPADTLKAGDIVTIEAYVSTRNDNEMRAERITFGETTIELR